MPMTKEHWGSVKELLIHVAGMLLGALVTFPALWIMTIAELPKEWLYAVCVAGMFGPFVIIEINRKHVNYNKELAEHKKWEDFAKMKRPGWPWNRDEPLTEEDILKYM